MKLLAVSCNYDYEYDYETCLSCRWSKSQGQGQWPKNGIFNDGDYTKVQAKPQA